MRIRVAVGLNVWCCSESTAASLRQRSAEVSPERVSIAGVLWSTLWWRVCVQLGKIHVQTSLFRLQELGFKAKDYFSQGQQEQTNFTDTQQNAKRFVQFVSGRNDELELRHSLTAFRVQIQNCIYIL